MPDFISVCEEAARAGGQVLLDWQDRFEVQKKGPRDLVTQADFASQETIRQLLLGAFPDHDFLGEEETAETVSAVGQPRGEYRWIVDPLDGTLNYVHRLQTFAVSIALERAGEIIAATIYDPVMDECYTAELGKGAFLNGQPLRASGCSELEEAMLVASFSTQVTRESLEVARFVEVLPLCQALRRLGSAALNLAYVAAGRLDAYWATSVRSWDVAAGVLLVREAGGVVTGLDETPFDLENPRFIAASTPSLREEIATAFVRAVK